jgi:non-canonical (house-cleaning) NTP pyrophosphatase
MRVSGLSQIKIEACRRAALRYTRGKVYCNVEGQKYGSFSGVNPQPVGIKETREGCACRLHSTIISTDDNWWREWFVAIENGVLGEPGEYVDSACVQVHNFKTKRTTEAWSAGVHLPKSMGMRKVVGTKPYAEQLDVDNTKDPHKFITGVSRVHILADAVYLAMKQHDQPEVQRVCNTPPPDKRSKLQDLSSDADQYKRDMAEDAKAAAKAENALTQEEEE